MNKEGSLFDLGMDLGGSMEWLTAPVSFDHGPGQVLQELSSLERWPLTDQCGSSPVDEFLQDSIWPDHAEVLGSAPLFADLQSDDVSSSLKKFSTSTGSFWCDDEYHSLQPVANGTDYSLQQGLFVGESLTLPGTPMDVKFELGDVFGDQGLDIISDSATQFFDNFGDSHSCLSIVQSTSITPFKPIDSYVSESVLQSVESVVPFSPLFQMPSSLDDLEDEDDSLHDAESVCQILQALGGKTCNDSVGFLRGSSSLSLASTEEVESVLSPEGSCENLVALDEPACSIGTVLTVVSSSGVANQYIISAPTLSISSPALSIAAPAMSVQAQQLSISAPTLSISAPLLSISAPAVSYSAPATSCSAPVSSGTWSTIASDYKRFDLMTKQPASEALPCASPYGAVLTERKLRKKEQNKSAALRYRQKKRQEKGYKFSEVEELEQENSQLRTRADELSREISYLRGLLEEITKH